MRLFLVGYMGCGKSSLGKKLSKALNLRFVDTDAEIERREGASVNDIFRYEGEEYFRKSERRVIEEIIEERADVVVSTGGGLPLWRDNMELMNGAGVTIFLKRSAEQIASRLSPHGRQKRPKLRGLNDEELVAFMRENMLQREPYYKKAQLCIDCVPLSDAELVKKIIEYVDEQ
ncbi:MAG: shikimate kinase [Alistipes sp.]|nr:shikimate kinase [Alistipes sp.]